MQITRPHPIKVEHNLYRVNINAPAKYTPSFWDSREGKQYETNLIDLSGSGCKIKLPDGWISETKQAIVEFSIEDDNFFKLYCEVVRCNTPHHLIALQFTAPYVGVEENEPEITLREIQEKNHQFRVLRLRERRCLTATIPKENKERGRRKERMAEESLKMCRLDVDIPAMVTPIIGSEQQPKIKTKIVCFMKNGCKIQSLTLEEPKAKQAVVAFNFNNDFFRIFCEVERFNKELGIIALRFSYPYGVPETVINPYVWLEERIFAAAQEKPKAQEANGKPNKEKKRKKK